MAAGEKNKKNIRDGEEMKKVKEKRRENGI